MSEKNALPQGQLMDIGTVAAHNIVQTLGLPSTAVETVRDAIRDEIKMMSSHFTLAVAETQFEFEKQVAHLKSAYRYANENPIALAAASFAVFVFGFLVGKFA